MTPKIVHQIWLGRKRIPEHFCKWMDSWKQFYPDWEYRLWTDAEVKELTDLVCPYIFEFEYNVGLKSDVLRMELLHKFGGLYADCDFECLQSMEHLFKADCFHYGNEREGEPSNAWMCSAPKHQIPLLVLKQLRDRITEPTDIGYSNWREVVTKTGPYALARALNYWIGEWIGKAIYERGEEVGWLYQGNVVSFKRHVLFPYWGNGESWQTFSREKYPRAMAAHHWMGSWLV